MKHWHKISFPPGRDPDSKIADTLRELGLNRHRWTIDHKVDLVDIWVPYERPGPPDAIEHLKQRGYRPTYMLDWTYDPEDYDSALLFILVVTRAMVIGPTPPRNADWDLSRLCQRCGAGAEPRGGMRLNRSSIPKGADVIETDLNEYHVSTCLKEMIENELGPLEDFRRDAEVRHPDRHLPWWHLRPSHVLPPLSPKSVNVGTRCAVCSRGPDHGPDQERPTVQIYEFNEDDASSLPPFSRSFEWSGGQLVEDEVNRIGYGRQYIRVNRACREFFLRNKIRHVDFMPIETRVIS